MCFGCCDGSCSAVDTADGLLRYVSETGNETRSSLKPACDIERALVVLAWRRGIDRPTYTAHAENISSIYSNDRGAELVP